jgi:hypothetical protein
MTHRFKLALTWKGGMTAGDRQALIDALDRELFAPLDLMPETVTVDGDIDITTYRFTQPLTDDQRHDVCRSILRWIRRRYSRAIGGIGFSDRTWWRPKHDPTQDEVEPMLDAMLEAP